MSIRLKQLFRFPVKSCAGEECNQVQLTQGRILGDRDWSIVKETNKGFEILSQREEPRLCLIKPKIQDEGLTLKISGYGELFIPIQKLKQIEINRRRKKIKDFDPVALSKTCFAYDQGKNASNFLSQFLGYNCHLVYQDPKQNLSNDMTDQGAVSVIAEESRNALEKALHESGDQCPPMINFRPNLVIFNNGNSAFYEDRIKGMKGAHLDLFRTGQTTRCFMPEINQETAQRDLTFRFYMPKLMQIRDTDRPLLGSFFKASQDGEIKQDEELDPIDD